MFKRLISCALFGRCWGSCLTVSAYIKQCILLDDTDCIREIFVSNFHPSGFAYIDADREGKRQTILVYRLTGVSGNWGRYHCWNCGDAFVGDKGIWEAAGTAAFAVLCPIGGCFVCSRTFCCGFSKKVSFIVLFAS